MADPSHQSEQAANPTAAVLIAGPLLCLITRLLCVENFPEMDFWQVIPYLCCSFLSAEVILLTQAGLSTEVVP